MEVDTNSEEYYDLVLNKMMELYGKNIASPVQEPIRFRHQCKIAAWKIRIKQ